MIPGTGIFDRHVLRLFLGTWLVSSVFLAGMYLVIHFFAHLQEHQEAAEAFATQGWTLYGGLLRYYALNVPVWYISQLGAFALLMAAMYTVHHLDRGNEIVPHLAAGAGFLRIFLPVGLAAAAVSLLLVVARETWIPARAGNCLVMERLFKGKTDRLYTDIPIILDGFGSRFACGSYDVAARVMHSVLWVPSESLGHLEGRETFASLAFLDGGPAGPGWYATEADGTRERVLTDLLPRNIEVEKRGRAFLSLSDLRDLYRKNPHRLDVLVLAHSHVTYGFTPLVLILLGVPLVARRRRRSMLVSVGLCVVLSAVFYSFSAVLLELGQRGQLVSPLLGAWLPVVLFASAGVVLLEGIRT